MNTALTLTRSSCSRMIRPSSRRSRWLSLWRSSYRRGTRSPSPHRRRLCSHRRSSGGDSIDKNSFAKVFGPQLGQTNGGTSICIQAINTYVLLNLASLAIFLANFWGRYFVPRITPWDLRQIGPWITQPFSHWKNSLHYFLNCYLNRYEQSPSVKFRLISFGFKSSVWTLNCRISAPGGIIHHIFVTFLIGA